MNFFYHQMLKVAFDRPYEIEVGRKSLVAIKPQVITSSKYVKKYSPVHRQCYYSSERRLKFFRLYTKGNCEHECLANFTKVECGCVKFSMPRKKFHQIIDLRQKYLMNRILFTGDSETRICGVLDLACYSNAVRIHRSKNYKNDTAAEFRDNCFCLPSCADVRYATEVTDLKYIVGQGMTQS